jgi:GNAT superfamily N-acetyltransferase
MQIRKAEIADIEPLAVLFDQYRIFYKSSSDIKGAKEFIEERIKKNQSTIFLAISDNEIIGFTQLYPIFSSVSMKRTWLLNDLFVHEKARKKGVAQALLNAATSYGSSTTSKWLLLQTGEDNTVAQALYEKNGWKKVSDIFYQFDI